MILSEHSDNEIFTLFENFSLRYVHTHIMKLSERIYFYLAHTYLLLMQNVHSDLTLAVAVCIEKKSNKMQ